MSKKTDNLIHLLHVDDDHSFLEVSKLVMTDIDNSLEIDVANSVDEANLKLKTKQYDIIISDYEMPIQTGLDLLRGLRNKKNQIPFILFTGKGREAVAIQALNYGADRYLDKHGNPETVYNELVINIHQLCEKAQDKKLLWESEERFKRMMDNITDVAMLTKPDGTVLYISPSCKEFLGYEQSEFVGKHFSVAHPDDCEELRKVFVESLTAEVSSGILEYRVLTKSGETKWVHHSYSQIIEIGQVKQVVSIFTDITHRVLFELSIAESEAKYKAAEEKYRATFESTGTAVIIIEEDTTISLVNAEWEKLTGYSKEETEGKKKWTELVADENLDWMKKQHKLRRVNSKAAARQYEFKLKTKNGDIKHIYLTVSNLPGNKESIASLADITEGKKIREMLQKSEYLYRMITQNIEDVVILADSNAIFLYVSPSIKKMFGFEPDELVGKRIFDFLYPDDLTNVVLPNFHKALLGEAFPSIEIRSRTKNGDYLWIECTLNVIKDATGDVKFVIVCRNIGKRKKAEKNIAIVNEKLRVVGQLTRHDVRNKLSVINGTTYIIKKKHPDDLELIQDLTRIESAVKMSNRLLEFTKLYEAMGVEEQVVVDVKRCFDEAVALFHNLDKIKISNKADGLTAVADSLLRQIFYDLIDNSLKHGKKVTKISLYYTKAEDKIKLYYEDNGEGISLEDKPKLFHEGFTTGEGTGLGLWLIKKVLDVYHWSIQEIGVQGKGVKFEVTIPFSKANEY